MLFSKAKTDFLEYLEIEQNRSQKTIANYDHYLIRLIDFAGDIEVSDINGEMIRKWRLWLNRLGTNTSDELQKNTMNYHLIALRSFLKFCTKRRIQIRYTPGLIGGPLYALQGGASICKQFELDGVSVIDKASPQCWGRTTYGTTSNPGESLE